MLEMTRTTRTVSKRRDTVIEQLPRSAVYVGIGTARVFCLTKIVVIVLHDSGDEEAVHVEMVEGVVFMVPEVGVA